MNMLPSCVKYHLVQSTGEKYIENCMVPSNKGFAKGLDQPIGWKLLWVMFRLPNFKCLLPEWSFFLNVVILKVVDDANITGKIC